MADPPQAGAESSQAHHPSTRPPKAALLRIALSEVEGHKKRKT
jgi:hypothetical protein